MLYSDVGAQKLTLGIASGNPPQIVMPTGLVNVNAFLDKGVWEDLAPRLDADGLKLDQLYLPALGRAARITPYYGPESTHVLALPVVAHGHFIGVNNDLFAKAGVPVPTPPTARSLRSYSPS